MPHSLAQSRRRLLPGTAHQVGPGTENAQQAEHEQHQSHRDVAARNETHERRGNEEGSRRAQVKRHDCAQCRDLPVLPSAGARRHLGFLLFRGDLHVVSGKFHLLLALKFRRVSLHALVHLQHISVL